jgi:hypothetical protein
MNSSVDVGMQAVTGAVKVCSKCQIQKSLADDFYAGRRSWCITCCSTTTKERRQKQPLTGDSLEHRRAYMKAYKRTDAYRQKNAAQKRGRPVEVQMFQAARERARKKGLEFGISVKDIIVPSICPLLDIPIKRGSVGMHPNSPTLDRKNAALGYVPGNVWVIYWRANKLKSDATGDEIRLLSKRLTENGL